MAVATRKSLAEYLALEYPFHVIADPDGGYVATFPDLPGCMTQAESLAELATMADDARRNWITTAFDHQMDIPLPSYPETYSGKFNVRLPRALHRSLAEAAEDQGISLNQYVLALLARGDAQARIEGRLASLEQQLSAVNDRLRFQVTGVPSATERSKRFQVISGGGRMAV